jgi:hypothetical protein
MALSAFDNKATPPTDAALRVMLGRAWPSWKKLRADIRERISPIDDVWGFASSTTGWGLRLRHKDRVIVYMTPQKSQFLFSIVLGEKAVTLAEAARLPAALSDAIDAAPRYAEGRGIRVIVKSSKDIAGLLVLAQIKCDNKLPIIRA